MSDRASPDEPLRTRTEAEGATVDLPEGLGFFTTGQVLGERYEILEMLGRGGMGEVWRAFDLKLRVEVGLKALREDLFQSEQRLELLRQEVRAAREVVSPNVCRIFDLIEIEGRELVSMEYVDGATLLGVLQERGPLELKEAQDIASQFLSGLEAIHKAGLVHRDVKPENIMLTRAGRVVVMDFGLARGPESGAGSVSGTPAYMAPEHASGGDVDARADVYSAGVVLAEMVSPEGIKSYESRQSVWEGVRSEPAQIPDSPWAPVIKRAVARDRERRQNSAHTLIRELEDVTLRVEGAEDLHPYPGLASFTEDDAEYFFGREGEIEQMWRRLAGAPRLLAIMGPSGAGKTSFIRAGLIPNTPHDWAIIRCTPGNVAIASLRGALTSVLSHGSENLTRLLTDPDNPNVIVETMATARKDHAGALLVVDQFEELFTLNPPEHQRLFTEILARLPLEANTHVVLSMRDDFASFCGTHEALQPVFNELTMLNPPTGGNLRRALVQPANKCGYRFEDDELIEEILAEVEGERGALPLLAFALARLWEKRDRETGLLTRPAYHDIGGVGGALARHAESTVDRIGVERIPVVRELFRNLVTAEGTRAVREWDELLSVFGDGGGREGIEPSPTKTHDTTLGAGFTPARDAASDVLAELIDARLLTSYEVREDEYEPIRRVEIIHESLLANWPRLVRWQTQDQEGAQLRDELRQSARTWDEHGRHDDRLWTGTAYREFRLWQERYPGGLTGTEESFASAMTSLAERRRRRRRLIVASVIAALVVGLAVVGSFWQRSVRQTRRAEAQKLFALAQTMLESDHTASLAYTIASLELADDPEVRKLAVESLWRGPQRFIIDDRPSWGVYFTPDGHRAIMSMEVAEGPQIEVLGVDGTRFVFERLHRNTRVNISISPDGNLFTTSDWSNWPEPKTIALWSISESTPLATHDYENDVQIEITAWSGGHPILLVEEDDRRSVDALGEDGSYRRLGTIGEGYAGIVVDRQTGRWIGAITGDEVAVLEIGETSLGEPKRLGLHVGVSSTDFHPSGDFLVTASPNGEIRLWDPSESVETRELEGPPDLTMVSLMGDGSVLTAYSRNGSAEAADLWSLTGENPQLLRHFEGDVPYPDIWDSAGETFLTFLSGYKPPALLQLSAPPEAEPIPIGGHSWGLDFHPAGDWVSTTVFEGAQLWHLSRPFSVVIDRSEQPVFDLEFERDGQFLAAAGGRNSWVRVWPMEGDVPAAAKTMIDLEGRGHIYGVAVSPDGGQLLGLTGIRVGLLQATSGGPLRLLHGAEDILAGGAFSPDGVLAAAPTLKYSAVPSAVHLWEVSTGRHLAAIMTGSESHRHLHFLSEDRFLVATKEGLMIFGVDGELDEMLLAGSFRRFAVSRDGRHALLLEGEEPAGGPERAVVLDLETGMATPLTSHGSGISSVAIDPTGSFVVTGNADGVIRVGPITGEEPHLFLAHSETIETVAVDPLGRWVASGSRDKTIRLWPMPDLSKPPLHTLPREELIAKLKTLTNLRVVRDSESSTGWTLTHDPFLGWETVPTW